MKFHLTPKSLNKKTGPIPVTTSPMTTCPSCCPLRENGCYADTGPLGLHWRKVTEGERGCRWPEFLELIAGLPEGQLWRHNQAGDLVSQFDDRESIHSTYLEGLVAANEGKRGFTYTHYPVLRSQALNKIVTWNKRHILYANQHGFTINLSSNTVEHADQLFDLNIGPVTTHLPSWATKASKTPAGNRLLICPAVSKENMTCVKCGLCAKYPRKQIIAFPAHGTRKNCLDRFIRLMED